MLNIFSYQVLTKLQSLIQRIYNISELCCKVSEQCLFYKELYFDKLLSVAGQKILHATDTAKTMKDSGSYTEINS